MKKLVCFMFTAGLITAVILCGCVSTDPVEQTQEREQAGKIIIYTSMPMDVIEAVKSSLSGYLHGYEIQFVYGGTGVLQQRIAAERLSGKLGCDILMVAEPAYSLELKEAGILHSFKYSDASKLAFDYDPDGYWYPVRVSNMVLAFNPALHAKNTVPDSFEKFVNDSRLSGAISMRNPLVSGTTMSAITALRDKYGYDYFDSLGRQKVKIDYGSEETITKLENGECIAAMVLEESVLKAKQEKNSPLEVIYPADGVVVIPSNIMIVNDNWSANKNASVSEKIAEWFLSIEGQSAIIKGWMHTVRNDFHDYPKNSIPIEEIRSNSLSVNWENVSRQRAQIIARFEEAIISGR